MKKDILSWNDVKQKYLEFHKINSFTEDMAINVDFGYWLVNKLILPNESTNIDFDKLFQDYLQNFVSNGGFVKSTTFRYGTQPYHVFEWFKKKLS